MYYNNIIIYGVRLPVWVFGSDRGSSDLSLFYSFVGRCNYTECS